MTSQTRFILKVISFLGLAMSLLPPFLFLGGIVARATYLWLMVLGMVMWFGAATFWIKRDSLNG